MHRLRPSLQELLLPLSLSLALPLLLPLPVVAAASRPAASLENSLSWLRVADNKETLLAQDQYLHLHLLEELIKTSNVRPDAKMVDELRVYRADDPNDAPERRLYSFVNGVGLNPFMPASLPRYVIPPIANSLAAMQLWCLRYSAYQQQQHQQQQHQLQNYHMQQQQQQQQQQRQQQQQQQQQQEQPQQNQQQHQQLQHQDQQQQQLQTYQMQQQQHEHEQRHQLQNDQIQKQQQLQLQQRLNSSSPISQQHHSHPSSPGASSPTSSTTSRPQKPHSHIKKPLNPFMIYMQKRRPEIVRQGVIKESAAINQMLGQQWRQLSKEQQEPYYKLAEEAKQLHALRYPGWSARDNYAIQKKKKKLKLKSITLDGLDQLDKKCRARFGLTNMAAWCKPCKRKKKCILART